MGGGSEGRSEGTVVKESKVCTHISPLFMFPQFPVSPCLLGVWVCRQHSPAWSNHAAGTAGSWP